MGPGDFARFFQAVRIAVNDELDALKKALPLLRDRLNPGGILAVIAYHSGEDRLVKHAMREWSMDCICPPKQLQCTCRGHALGKLVTKRATIASRTETSSNPRSRSARLRAWRSAASALRGRTLVALVLAAFVLVALSIVWRRTIGIGQAERLATLDAKRPSWKASARDWRAISATRRVGSGLALSQRASWECTSRRTNRS